MMIESARFENIKSQNIRSHYMFHMIFCKKNEQQDISGFVTPDEDDCTKIYKMMI